MRSSSFALVTPPVACQIPGPPSAHFSNALAFGSLATITVHMRSRYTVREPDQAHFVTGTIVEWLPVFTSRACCEILVDSLVYCRRAKGLKIYGWVILDNHFHAILQAPNLSSVLRDFKSFTAAKVVEQIKAEGRDWLLAQFRFYRAVHKTSDHQIWQEGSHPQAICSDEIMRQKLDYLHNNPVKRGWVASPEHWRYSSAHEWLSGTEPLLTCDEWL